MMHTHSLEFKIDQMRKDKMILSLMSINIFILSLFVSVFLPQLLFQFIYSNQNLTAEPAVLTYIPALGFATGVLFFIYAAVMMVMKKMKIMQLEKELSMMMTDDCNCECSDCNVGDHSHHTISDSSDMSESMSAPKKKSVKRKVAKKA